MPKSTNEASPSSHKVYTEVQHAGASLRVPKRRIHLSGDEAPVVVDDPQSVNYTATVDPNNFAGAGALFGMTSTTGDALDFNVIGDNVLTFEFGYNGDGSIGDFVFEDTNGNGLQDDGPGFDPGILDRLGEPYFSTSGRDTRQEPTGPHMGLGIFIAQTLLNRGGASLSFANRQNGGAEVTVSWPRDRLEAAAESVAS